jgi:hypothetical protein
VCQNQCTCLANRVYTRRVFKGLVPPRTVGLGFKAPPTSESCSPVLFQQDYESTARMYYYNIIYVYVWVCTYTDAATGSTNNLSTPSPRRWPFICIPVCHRLFNRTATRAREDRSKKVNIIILSTVFEYRVSPTSQTLLQVCVCIQFYSLDYMYMYILYPTKDKYNYYLYNNIDKLLVKKRVDR